MLNTCVHHKAKSIYDSWYADIRILGSMRIGIGLARYKNISRTAYAYLHSSDLYKPRDRYVFNIYGSINIHIVKY